MKKKILKKRESKDLKKVSVIIPTLNEEKYLPRLLECLKKQDFENFEIIVSDAHSTDRTRAIAKEYGAKVVDGGMPGVARNSGAKIASGEYLFLIDADVIVPDDFLTKAYTEMNEKQIKLATCDFIPLTVNKLDRLIHSVINIIIHAERKYTPQAFGFCILVTKKLFEQIKGFDESIVLAEDLDFVKRAFVFSPLEILKSSSISVSIRRFAKEGRFRYMIKGIRISMHRIFRGEIRTDVIKYEFAEFGEKKDEKMKVIKSQKNIIVKKSSKKSSNKKIMPRAAGSAAK